MQQINAKSTSTPKTTLGFYNLYLGLVLAGGAGLVTTLGFAGAPIWAVVATGGATLLLAAAVLVIVVILNFKAPEKLMLGEVNASGYSQITQSRTPLGDSQAGKRSPTELLPTSAATDEDIVEAETVEEATVHNDATKEEEQG